MTTKPSDMKPSDRIRELAGKNGGSVIHATVQYLDERHAAGQGEPDDGSSWCQCPGCGATYPIASVCSNCPAPVAAQPKVSSGYVETGAVTTEREAASSSRATGPEETFSAPPAQPVAAVGHICPSCASHPKAAADMRAQLRTMQKLPVATASGVASTVPEKGAPSGGGAQPVAAEPVHVGSRLLDYPEAPVAAEPAEPAVPVAGEPKQCGGCGRTDCPMLRRGDPGPALEDCRRYQYEHQLEICSEALDAALAQVEQLKGELELSVTNAKEWEETARESLTAANERAARLEAELELLRNPVRTALRAVYVEALASSYDAPNLCWECKRVWKEQK